LTSQDTTEALIKMGLGSRRMMWGDQSKDIKLIFDLGPIGRPDNGVGNGDGLGYGKKGVKMYLFIFEDGSLAKSLTVDDEDYKSADEGYLDIINVTNDQPVQYHDGDWHGINDV